MVQFNILSGNKAGRQFVARRFPVRIGRLPQNEVQLEDAGVWDAHALLDAAPPDGIRMELMPGALGTVNGAALPASSAVRNGDVFGFGAVRLQFWLSPPAQKNMAFREALAWVAIAGICLLQIALIYLLLKA
jgi:hypothetical protein